MHVDLAARYNCEEAVGFGPQVSVSVVVSDVLHSDVLSLCLILGRNFSDDSAVLMTIGA